MTQVTTDKLMDDLRVVVQDAEELLRATAGQAGEKIAAARIRAEASLRSAKERLSGMQEDVMEEARRIAKQTDEYVQNNPWQSVGIAAAAGLLVGLVIGRR